MRGVRGEVDGFLAPSKYIAKMAKEFFSCPIEIVYDPVLNIKQLLSRKSNLASKNICFVGTYSPRKGLERLMVAFQIVREKYPEAKLYLVGEIPSRFSGPGVILTGRVPTPELYMEKCSLYVHPAIYEPFGLPVIEAILVGLVPVATKNTGAAEFLDKELVVDGSPESLSAKITELFGKGPSELKKISLRLKRRILRKGFEPEKRLKEFRRKFWRLASAK
ncbi:MAG: glycosyltransferase family 4 protein [Candidatus Hadarchaeales archaeon]